MVAQVSVDAASFNPFALFANAPVVVKNAMRQCQYSSYIKLFIAFSLMIYLRMTTHKGSSL